VNYSNFLRDKLAESLAKSDGTSLDDLRKEREATNLEALSEAEYLAQAEAVGELCRKLTKAKKVPGYAKAGFKKRQQTVDFAHTTLHKITGGDRGWVTRFFERLDVFEDLLDDLNTANWSRGNVPLILFPVSEIAAVRGEAFEAPEDQTNMPPLARAEQPIHWDD
jgi:hypothetical protein